MWLFFEIVFQTKKFIYLFGNWLLMRNNKRRGIIILTFFILVLVCVSLVNAFVFYSQSSLNHNFAWRNHVYKHPVLMKQRNSPLQPNNFPVSLTADVIGAGANQRVNSAKLMYQGAFRLPVATNNQFDSGAKSIAYYPMGDKGSTDGYPGSLFGSGRDIHNVSEVSIPAPLQSRVYRDLPVATTLQDFTDITDGVAESLTHLPEPRLDRFGGLAFVVAQG